MLHFIEGVAWGALTTVAVIICGAAWRVGARIADRYWDR